MSKGEKEIVREEALKRIVFDYETEKKSRQGDKELEIKEQYRGRRLKTILTKAAFYGLAALSFAFSIGALIKADVFKQPELWVQGGRPESSPEIEGCIINLWRLRKGVDLYYAAYGKFPSSAGELYENGFLKKRPLCPASAMEYLLKETQGQKSFVCPRPQEHNVLEVRVGLESGPVAIRRE